MLRVEKLKLGRILNMHIPWVFWCRFWLERILVVMDCTGFWLMKLGEETLAVTIWEAS